MTVYVSSDVQPGSTLRYGDWLDKPYTWNDGTAQIHPMTLIEHTVYGDYDNSCAVERSNHRVMLADPDIAPHVVQLHGSHGTAGLAYLGDFKELPEALRDAISALADYPILDESDESELEMEMESEAWSASYGGSRDFAKALLEYINGELPEDVEHEELNLSDGQLWELWRDGCDAFNVNGGSGFEIESGGNVHFYIDRWICYFGDRAGDTRVCPYQDKRNAMLVRYGLLPAAPNSEIALAVEIMLVSAHAAFVGIAYEPGRSPL